MSQTQSLPLYVQISEMLIRDIQAGRLLDGERLPPEREMAAALEISVGTLRKALAELAKQGLLERLQGSGNYVRHRGDAESVYAFFRLELLEGGGLPTADVVSVATLAKPAELPDFGRSWMAHRIRRLRRLNGLAAALEEIWLDASYTASLRARDLSESLYFYYRTALGLWIQRAEDRIGVAEAPDWGKGLLDMDNVGSLAVVDRQSWDQDGQVAEVSRTWFDPRVCRYVSRLK
ncbi:MAG: GntR family transcriptional regulator [Rhodobacter sp.]|nr:GntR family transcriptional regulator [Rhodobacter sp.]